MIYLDPVLFRLDLPPLLLQLATLFRQPCLQSTNQLLEPGPLPLVLLLLMTQSLLQHCGKAHTKYLVYKISLLDFTVLALNEKQLNVQ